MDTDRAFDPPPAALARAERDELEALRRRLLAAEQELSELPDLREAAVQLDVARARVAALESALAHEQQAVMAAKEEARRVHDELALELDAVRRELRAVYASRSWRITKPLRRGRTAGPR